MSVELKVPSVGESITEVQIGDWLKSVGDSVQRDEVLVMIETDKVTVELPAPIAGVLTEIKVQKGSTANVGDVIGFMEEATVVSPAPDAERAPKAETPKPAAASAPAAAPLAEQKSAPMNTATPQRTTQSPEAEPKSVRSASVPPEGFARVMPSARRVMAEEKLTLDQVQATGPGGRILKEDAMRAAQAPAPAPAPSPPAPPTTQTMRAPQSAPEAPVTMRGASGGREEEVVAMTPMRKRIAERLVQSLQTTAQLTTFNEVDMTDALALRKEYQERFVAKYSTKLGIMSFFVKAAIEALKMVPEVNAEVRGTDIVYKNYYDIGVAVGSGKGLVVPIIRNTERLSFAEIEQAIGDYGKRAQAGKLKLDELQGGTFTISNGGVYGNLLSTPIINPPQSGILGLHAIQERAMVRNGTIVVRSMMYVALSYDHRIVDGREAVAFLKRIKECVEEPARILLEI
jgi:2-oxoglutarate dehydrogenase E2 component (dihydrolipoamide succinyltransferase)